MPVKPFQTLLGLVLLGAALLPWSVNAAESTAPIRIKGSDTLAKVLREWTR
ncbi:MAG: hypothetical protein HQM00_14390, partial [Magnetococcales bacterium]|nr:hypothetical protein [Magnetococcales bacterium]